MRNDAKFSQAVDKFGEILGKNAKNVILTGETAITKKGAEDVVGITEENLSGFASSQDLTYSVAKNVQSQNQLT